MVRARPAPKRVSSSTAACRPLGATDVAVHTRQILQQPAMDRRYLPVRRLQRQERPLDLPDAATELPPALGSKRFKELTVLHVAGAWPAVEGRRAGAGTRCPNTCPFAAPPDRGLGLACHGIRPLRRHRNPGPAPDGALRRRRHARYRRIEGCLTGGIGRQPPHGVNRPNQCPLVRLCECGIADSRAMAVIQTYRDGRYVWRCEDCGRPRLEMAHRGPRKSVCKACQNKR